MHSGGAASYTDGMFSVRKRLRSFAWLALLAMLAMALMPTVSHALALAKAPPGGWTEVCTPQGAQWVALDGSPIGETVPAGGADHQLDCPYCRPASSLVGLLPTAPLQWQLPIAGNAAPPLFFHAARTLFAWASAQPRGPPSLS